MRRKSRLLPDHGFREQYPDDDSRRGNRCDRRTDSRSVYLHGSGELKLLVGTDAASEGLNLQMLGTLINVDLPWNPTRLEQRKGRIQRIGQVRSAVNILNLRYAPSVEDKVHLALSSRLEEIRKMFGQIPDVLSDVWVQVALGDIEQARQRLDEVKPFHAFDERYSRVEDVSGWDECAQVLNRQEKLEVLRKGWVS